MTHHVCLDPGHGVETAGKRSPDGTYLEHEFNLDMAKRMREILTRCGVRVTLTRETAHTVSLERRVQIANRISGLSLFVSLHSNAVGRGGWRDDVRGYVIFTSQPGETAARNRAAKAILARVRGAGIGIWGSGLSHSLFYVLRYTKAPAVLIEHGFHTSRGDVALLKTDAYRQKLAEANCRGICDHLGLPYAEGAGQAAQPGQPGQTAQPGGETSPGASSPVAPAAPVTAPPTAPPTASEVAAAVDALAAAGVILDPAYWKAGVYSAENVHHLLVKTAKIAKRAN